MIRLIRFCLLAIHFVVTTSAGMLIGICRPFNPTNSRWCAYLYGKIGLPIIGINTHAEGLENFNKNHPCVVVANHQSNWDLFVVGSVVPNRTVSVGKKSLKWVPLFGQLYWLAGNVLVDRGNSRKAMESMALTKEALTTKNTSIWFFAEGTRNKGKNMLPFKKGGFITAINAGVPIVPVCCNSYLKYFDLNKLDNNTAYLRVLPAISTEGYTQDNVKELMAKVHTLMMDTIKELDELATQDLKAVTQR